jgi:hypothetical protein
MNGSAVHCDATCSPENPIESTMAAMRKGPLAEPFSKRLFLRLSSLKKDVLTRVISDAKQSLQTFNGLGASVLFGVGGSLDLCGRRLRDKKPRRNPGGLDFLSRQFLLHDLDRTPNEIGGAQDRVVFHFEVLGDTRNVLLAQGAAW